MEQLVGFRIRWYTVRNCINQCRMLGMGFYKERLYPGRDYPGEIISNQHFLQGRKACRKGSLVWFTVNFIYFFPI